MKALSKMPETMKFRTYYDNVLSLTNAVYLRTRTYSPDAEKIPKFPENCTKVKILHFDW
jgi:hypothetical protein